MRLALANIFTTRMLTRDLFVVTNLLVEVDTSAQYVVAILLKCLIVSAEE